MRFTGILLVVGLLSAGSMYELFGAKDTIHGEHPGNTDVFKDEHFHRRDLIYFSGPRGNITVNVTSNILQVEDDSAGIMQFHAELHNAKNDTLIIGVNSLYHEDGRVIKFNKAGDRASANLFIPYIWNFPIYVTTYITRLD
jgi:hypothetical protein